MGGVDCLGPDPPTPAFVLTHQSAFTCSWGFRYTRADGVAAARKRIVAAKFPRQAVQ